MSFILKERQRRPMFTVWSRMNLGSRITDLPGRISKDYKKETAKGLTNQPFCFNLYMNRYSYDNMNG